MPVQGFTHSSSFHSLLDAILGYHLQVNDFIHTLTPQLQNSSRHIISNTEKVAQSSQVLGSQLTDQFQSLCWLVLSR